MKTVSAADANRHFSSVLREVAQGETFTVLSRGKPVAIISGAKAKDGHREVARANLIARLRAQGTSGSRNWSRDELYKR